MRCGFEIMVSDRAPGRAVGKHKDPQYVQTNIYLPRSLKTAVKIELLKHDRQLSELVESLVRGWLGKRGVTVRREAD